jgi:glycine/D-amino acid oxidase-like deaminating enzyme
MRLGERAREGWLRWNDEWAARGLAPLYHETGVLMISRSPMAPGGFEHDSYELLRRRGHRPVRLDGAALAQRYPAWRTAGYVDGFFHALGGYAESGLVMERLVAQACSLGVRLVTGRAVVALYEEGGRVHGVVDDRSEHHPATDVVVAAGAWTAKLTGLTHEIRPTGHPVFHLRPREPELFGPARFPVFTADIARTGYYGFPLNQAGVVKVGNHGPGMPVGPDAPRTVTVEQTAAFRAFLTETFPALGGADIVYTRLCLYSDSQDGDFWIARDPNRTGLTVASGGSGHGFKFAPVLGDLIADAVQEKPNPLLDRFRWRPEVRQEHGQEAARYHG